MSKSDVACDMDLIPTKDPLNTTPKPNGRQQREKISSLQEEEESVHVYCLAKAWYAAWQAFVGTETKGTSPSLAKNSRPISPGPLFMDLIDDEKNTYIDEKIWKCWVEWYGVSDTHQLDRRNWASDEKEFEICVLSPYSGIVANPSKAFDISEETGYIELQLRKIFKVPLFRSTRLWACEKARNARFHQVLDRTQEICYQEIDSQKPYILALEIASADGAWPTHMPGEPVGNLTKYAALTGMGGWGDNGAYWEKELEETINAVFSGISSELRETVNGVVSTTKCISSHKERDMEVVKDKLETKLHHLAATEKVLDKRVKDVTKDEEVIKIEKKKVMKDRAMLERERQQLKEEITSMEAMNKIVESKVRLNIGGHYYMTSMQTLTKEAGSMLAAMFSGRHSLKQDEDGSFFIDRDGTHFRYILNYLRDGGFKEGTIASDDTRFLNEILTEAEYYGLSGLVKLLQGYLGFEAPSESIGARNAASRISKRKISLLKDAKR